MSRDSIKMHISGNENGDALFCLHGLMGSINDFDPFKGVWGRNFQIFIPDLAPNAGKIGYKEVNNDKEEVLSYESSVDLVIDYIKEHLSDRKVIFTGISLGGKLCLEIAGRVPEIFAGAVLTDVGVGPLCESELFHFLDHAVPSFNLNQPWRELKAELKEKISDHMLRTLIQSRIEYPDGKDGSGKWKKSMEGFSNLVSKSRLEDQRSYLESIDAPIYILKGTTHSAISNSDFELMKRKHNFHFHLIDGANHFIQINNKKEYLNAGLTYFENIKSMSLKTDKGLEQMSQKTEKKEYLLGDSIEEIKRLGLLHNVFRDDLLGACQLAKVTKGSHVLDVGCGPGHTTAIISTLLGGDGVITAFDNSDEYLDYLNKRVDIASGVKIKTETGDMHAMPFADDSFDVVVCRLVLCFSIDLERAVQEMKRVLKPDGHLVILDWVNFARVALAPRSEILETISDKISKGWEMRGGQPSVGSDLPSVLDELDLEIIEMKVIQKMGHPGSDLWTFLYESYKQYLPRLEELSVIDSEESEEFLDDWQDRAQEKYSYCMNAPLISIVSKK